MANGYYNHGNLPGDNTPGSSAEIRAEFDAVNAGFDKIAPVTGNANKVVVINAAETGQTVKAADSLISDTINAATANTTPADAVEFGFWDNVAGALRKCSLTNLKAVLKTYFDTQYAALAGLATQVFSVAAATAAAHAVRKDQFDAGVVGSVIQTVSAAYSTLTSTTSATLVDAGLSATITPKYATSKILAIVSQTVTIPNGSTATYADVSLLRGATEIWRDQRVGGTAPAAGSNFHDTPSASILDSPATTSATTYKTQIASSTAGQAVEAQHANIRTSTITLLEIAQ